MTLAQAAISSLPDEGRRLLVAPDMRGWQHSDLVSVIDHTVRSWCQSHDLGDPALIQIYQDPARCLPDFFHRSRLPNYLCRIPCQLRFAPKPEDEELMNLGLRPLTFAALNESRYGRMLQRTFTILAADDFLPICYEEQELRDAIAGMPAGAEFCSHLMIRR